MALMLSDNYERVMRHVPENLLIPLLRILDEYEAWVKAKPKRTLKDHIRLYDIGRIRNAVSKKFKHDSLKRQIRDDNEKQLTKIRI